MTRITGRRALLEKMRALSADVPRLKDILNSVPPPDPVVKFLGQLELLQGVPFNYLVADEELLPPESMRFFQVDPNWIYALIEGAASIGCATSADAAHDAAARPALHDASTREARSVRAGPSSSARPLATSGFLLRSAVVSGWPGLEVAAYDGNNALLPVIRMERLAPSILLFWAEGIIHSVKIYEPPEGMHFGVDVLGGKKLRYVTVPPDAPPGAQPGKTIPESTQKITLRGKNVIAIDALADAAKKGLEDHHANNGGDGAPRKFTSAEFALQMVENAQQVEFLNVQSKAPGN